MKKPTFDKDPDAPFSHLLELASMKIEETRRELPGELRNALEGVAVVLEEFPSPEQEANGVASDQLGLFAGADASDSSSPEIPRMIIWLGNLWEMCGAEEAVYLEEVRITFLHELGHYLGFDEDDLFDRGLE